jgi:sulfate adenylyltransferase subunit 1 (EFTu-like GTPase family)
MHTTKEVQCKIKEVVYKTDINTLHRNEDDTKVNVNDLARIRLRLSDDIFYDDYQRNRFTGSFILVDEQSNQTVAAGMIESRSVCWYLFPMRQVFV